MKTLFNLHKKNTKHVILKDDESGVMNPLREWVIGLFFAFVGIICGGGYIAFDFYDQFYLKPSAQTAVETSFSYDKNSVRQQAQAYTEREKKFTALREEKPIAIKIENENPAEIATTSNEVIKEPVVENSVAE